MVGIYKITSPSGKVYIGQSWNIKKRFTWYKSHKAYQQPYLKNSFNKYGFDSHELKVLHELPKDVSQEVLDVYEVLYMQSYKDAGLDLLNIKEGGKGGSHGLETRQKMSISHSGKKLSQGAIKKLKEREYTENHRKGIAEGNRRREYTADTINKMKKTILCKPVNQFSKQSQFIKSWDSIKEASRALKIDGSLISRVCNNKPHQKHAGGFKWLYKSDYQSINN